jgi:hypothetical protein
VNLLIIGISFIALYFTLYYIVERKRLYRKNVSSREVPKYYLTGIFMQSKEELVINVGWVFLVVGIFLCLSYVLLETM